MNTDKLSHSGKVDSYTTRLLAVLQVFDFAGKGP